MTFSELQSHSAVADLFRRDISYSCATTAQTEMTISQVIFIKKIS